LPPASYSRAGGGRPGWRSRPWTHGVRCGARTRGSGRATGGPPAAVVTSGKQRWGRPHQRGMPRLNCALPHQGLPSAGPRVPRLTGRLAGGKPRGVTRGGLAGERPGSPVAIWPAGPRMVPFTFVPVTVRVSACQQSARRWSIGPDTGGCAAGRVDSPLAVQSDVGCQPEAVLSRRPKAERDTPDLGGRRREENRRSNGWKAAGNRRFLVSLAGPWSGRAHSRHTSLT
jgi:hypothetical protein